MAVGAVLVRAQGPGGHAAAPAGLSDPCNDSAAESMSSGMSEGGWADGGAGAPDERTCSIALVDRLDSAHYHLRPPGLLERQDSAHEVRPAAAPRPDRSLSSCGSCHPHRHAPCLRLFRVVALGSGDGRGEGLRLSRQHDLTATGALHGSGCRSCREQPAALAGHHAANCSRVQVRPDVAAAHMGSDAGGDVRGGEAARQQPQAEGPAGARLRQDSAYSLEAGAITAAQGPPSPPLPLVVRPTTLTSLTALPQARPTTCRMPHASICAQEESRWHALFRQSSCSDSNLISGVSRCALTLAAVAPDARGCGRCAVGDCSLVSSEPPQH